MPLVLIQVYLRNVEDSVLENSLSILWLTKKQAKEQKATAIATVIFAGANFSTLNALIAKTVKRTNFKLKN